MWDTDKMYRKWFLFLKVVHTHGLHVWEKHWRHWCQTLPWASVYRRRASCFNLRSRLCVSLRVLLHYDDMMNYIYWHWIKMQRWQQSCEKLSLFIMNGWEVSGVTLLYFSRLLRSWCVLYLPIHSAYSFPFIHICFVFYVRQWNNWNV